MNREGWTVFWIVESLVFVLSLWFGAMAVWSLQFGDPEAWTRFMFAIYLLGFGTAFGLFMGKLACWEAGL